LDGQILDVYTDQKVHNLTGSSQAKRRLQDRLFCFTMQLPSILI